MAVEENQKFHLGICMAGAITAGSYTAGVMDYLLETLERWQKQKDENKFAKINGLDIPYPNTPMYDVVIDVITGASAGGMCAGIATAMLLEGVNIDDLANSKSKMYRSWIELDDKGEEDGTIKKMLNANDLNQKDGIVSLLNSSVLDNIADDAVKVLNQTKAPEYVDKDLDIILTIANLRGIKYSIEFNSYGKTKKQIMVLHKDFMHFKLNTKPTCTSDFLNMDFTKPEDLELFKLSCIATGAFPVGLKPRLLTRDITYVYNKADVTLGFGNLSGNLTRTLSTLSGPYNSLNIDGGTFNNEPFGETERVLDAKAGKQKGEDTEFTNTNRTILMIDPFPSNELEQDSEDKKISLYRVAPRIIGALRQQSSFKYSDLLDALGNNNYSKFLITPSKSNTIEPLNCSSIAAFGGFLFKEFREHDYQLGRKNCQRFLRYHFTMPFDKQESAKNNPIHNGWTAQSIEKYIVSDTEKGIDYLPIIPDIQFEKNMGDNDPSIIAMPLVQLYPIEKLRTLEPLIETRIQKMIEVFDKLPKKEDDENEAVKEWNKQSGFRRFLTFIISFLLKPITLIVIWVLKRKVKKMIAKKVVNWIIIDLYKAKLLKKM